MKSATCFNARNGQPLSAYSSEGEALDAADYVKKKYGSRQEPYLCSKCGCWHLSPKERQTPSKVCTYCIGSGRLKDLYETIETAMTRAVIIEKERGVKLRVYKCPHREGYHLTHDKDEGGSGGKRPARRKKGR